MSAYTTSWLDARSLAHETGHNMGLHYERYRLLLDSEGTTWNLRALRYPSGVRFAGPIDRNQSTRSIVTIMAYGTECVETEGGQPYTGPLRFSNPNHKIAG